MHLCVGQMVWTLLRQEVAFVAGTVHELVGIDAVIFLANTCARQVEHPSNTLAELPNQTCSRRFFENFLDQLGSLNTFLPVVSLTILRWWSKWERNSSAFPSRSCEGVSCVMTGPPVRASRDLHAFYSQN